MQIRYTLISSTDISQLPDSVYQTALLSLSLENVSTRGMAEILQYFREGIYHPLIALNPEAEAEERPITAGSQKVETARLALNAAVNPNPFNDEVTFDLSKLSEGKYTLTVTDLLGRILWSRQVNGGQILVWSSSTLPEGQYLYHLRSEKGFVQSGKLMKIKK